MRIISEHHDYYDSLQGMGQDQSLIYLRKMKEEYFGPADSPRKTYPHLATYPFPSFSGHRYAWHRSHPFRAKGYTIGFCGKVYPVLRVRKVVDNQPSDESYYEKTLSESWCYRIEEVDDFVKSNFKDKQVSDYFEKGHRWSWRLKNWQWGYHHLGLKEFYDKHAAETDKHTNLFETVQAPIFVTYPYNNGWKLIVNCLLKKYNFQHLFDPYSAFQELQMYLSNIAQPNRPIPEVSNEDLIEAKGFDEWSFRKPPKDK